MSWDVELDDMVEAGRHGVGGVGDGGDEEGLGILGVGAILIFLDEIEVRWKN